MYPTRIEKRIVLSMMKKKYLRGLNFPLMRMRLWVLSESRAVESQLLPRHFLDLLRVSQEKSI